MAASATNANQIIINCNIETFFKIYPEFFHFGRGYKKILTKQQKISNINNNPRNFLFNRAAQNNTHLNKKQTKRIIINSTAEYFRRSTTISRIKIHNIHIFIH